MSQTPHDITLPPEFSGEAQLVLYTRYGDPREAGWDMKWITPWHIKADFPWFPAEHIHVHKHFKDMLKNAFDQLTILGFHTEITTFDGAYEVRNMRGSTVLSVHSWGAGIDLNEEQNQYGSTGVWTMNFIKTMEQYNIHCGQSWTGRKNPMHFSMVNG